jgi:hypothetical protein
LPAPTIEEISHVLLLGVWMPASTIAAIARPRKHADAAGSATGAGGPCYPARDGDVFTEGDERTTDLA